MTLSRFQYADNEDARQYDRRLRGPVDERRELAINPQTGTSVTLTNFRGSLSISKVSKTILVLREWE